MDNMYIDESTYIMTDKEYIEGIIGGIGWIVAVYFLKNYLGDDNGNIVVGGLLSWCILWYIRKIGVRWYMVYKKNYTDKDDFPLKVKVLLFFVLTVSALYILTNSKTINNNEVVVIVMVILMLFETKF
jgi:hypothetical protein